MKLMYLKQEAIDDLKVNFSVYRSHFCDETNEWFVKRFNEKGWIKESKIQCQDFELNYDDDFNVSDRKNIKILYAALKDLSPANALDERLWAGMLFGQLWNYVQYRRVNELSSGDEYKILSSFLYMQGKKRSCFLNCLSRLWWAGHLLYDSSNTNRYAAIDLITESAFASNLMLLSSNNFMSNKCLALGVMDCIINRKNKGEKIGRYHYVEATKYLNSIGGIVLLDMMSREEVYGIVSEKLKKIYGDI